MKLARTRLKSRRGERPLDEPVRYGTFVPKWGFWNRIWTTREGRAIRIREMEESHLRNAVRFMVRRNPDRGMPVEYYQGDDMWGEEEVYPGINGQEMMEWVDVMQAELRRRGKVQVTWREARPIKT